MLSERCKRRLHWADGGGRPRSPEQVADLFREAGLPCFPAVASAFSHYEGGRFRAPVDGRFLIYRAQDALRPMKKLLKSHPHQFEGYDDPGRFRIPFGESETIQARFSMDGHGQIFEDDRRVAADLTAWLEALGRS